MRFACESGVLSRTNEDITTPVEDLWKVVDLGDGTYNFCKGGDNLSCIGIPFGPDAGHDQIRCDYSSDDDAAKLKLKAFP